MADPQEISQIIDKEAEEHSELDYKRKEIIDKPNKVAKKCVIPMANSSGGITIIGVKEENDQLICLQDLKAGEIAKFRESLNQVLRQKSNPTLEPVIKAVNYSGSRFGDSQLCLIEVEQSNYPCSYRKNQNSPPVFPYRHGDGTDYMTGTDIAKYAEENTQPSKKVRETVENPHSDEEPHNENIDGNLEHDSPYAQEESYFFSKSEHTNFSLWTFDRKLRYFSQKIYTKSYKTDEDLEFLERTLNTLESCLNADLEDAYFGICQENAIWFGKGAKNFVKSLKQQSKRYSRSNYEISKHHSEGAQLITPVEGGNATISIQPPANESEKPLARHFVVGFSMNGIPIANNGLNQFVEKTGIQLNTAVESELSSKFFKFPENQIEIEPVRKITKKSPLDGDIHVRALIARNPFYKDREKLVSHLEESMNKDWLRTIEDLCSLEKIYFHLRDWHPVSEPKTYHLNELCITRTGHLSGGINTQNAHFQGTW